MSEIPNRNLMNHGSEIKSNILVPDSFSTLSNEQIALYVHIPFCETKCHYCDFNTYAGIESLVPSYIKALAAEIKTWG